MSEMDSNQNIFIVCTAWTVGVTTVTSSGRQPASTTPEAVMATRSPDVADTLPAVPTSRPSWASRRAASATCSRRRTVTMPPPGVTAPTLPR